ncbi:NADH-quinone oxidoreductase subunit NuoK [Opitutaceae bacterium TAV4]|uniref:NADH-quinone oxidoreductase subunit NuoK n=1 Tax=Geminisphaera colitermitum TaxID=1148786 RepID=UPI000158D3FC|nr:NADH-quinone oxidoreductase subunit NuoK [Geminisphaera colitermitum]RRJ97538.1 NADH-quinone oxidoreductase subunit NuoK [Opitutaceae bacterium TAV4]RRK01913.1 NADH-quinone oxidoreductase subunit NuoK [Opitutaceae bacterium TAV3]
MITSLSDLLASPLHLSLLFSAALFTIGLTTALARSSAILVLLGIELMLNAANINFIAFWRHGFDAGAAGASAASPATGVVFVIFSIAIAAAEAAVGLALIIALYRHRRAIRLQDATALKG